MGQRGNLKKIDFWTEKNHEKTTYKLRDTGKTMLEGNL